MTIPSANRSLVRLALLALPLALFYQNCGQVKLSSNFSQIATGSLASYQSRGIVPLPRPISGDLRAVFFVDNSDSMITGSCLTTLDYEALKTKPPAINCQQTTISGVDHDLKRVKIIRSWIADVENAYIDRPDLLAKVKMLIIPFSGGTPQIGLDSLFGQLPASTRFSSVAETKRVLDRMESMQNKLSGLGPVVDNVIQPMAAQSLKSYYGTSVPRTKLQKSMTALKTELDLLKDSGGRFEYVFISDGVPKPRGDHIEAAAVQIWSSLVETVATGWCLAPPGIPAYTPDDPNNPAQMGCLEWEFKTVGYDQCSSNTTCRQAVKDWANNGTITTSQATQCKACIDSLAKVTGQPFFDAVGYSWGSPMDNTTDAIFQTLGKIKTQQDQYADISYRFNFFRLDTLSPINYAIPPEERSKEINWLVKAKDIYKSGHRSLDIMTPEVEFGLFPGLSKNESYKLESIVALNVNARLNSVGVMDVDSDADGLFDFEEKQLATDPNNARSNGACLDLIGYRMGGCITMGCSSDIDSDADSLNECEEKTLGTSDFDFDTDGDGIPDAMEVLYGYNPMVSDLKVRSSTDQIDNFDRWKMGVPASLSLSNTRPDFLTQVIAEYQGQKSIVDSFNRTILVPEYIFQIENMQTTPLGGSSDIASMFMSKTRKASTEVIPRIVGGLHAPSVNRIVVLGKVSSVQNVGDSYWIGKVLEVSYEKEDQQVQINFDDLIPLQAVDPQQGSPP